MKKKILILILLLVMVTGCTNLSNKGISDLLPVVLKEKNTLANVVFEGYKYYVPRGLKLIGKEEYNATLLDDKQNTYYFYIDVVSFYNNEPLTFTISKEAYLSQKLNYHDKVGYIEINKIGKKGYYFIEYMYNYGKVEAYVKEKDIEDAIINMSSILSSISFNRTVLETIVGSKVLNYKEQTYNVMKPKGNTVTESYLDYEEKYGTYEGYSPKDTDEDQIKIEED